MRLLVVEDDPRLRDIVVRGLREAAYAVDAVADGDEALYQLSINPYDAVILDLMIPGPDGFEICRRLRAGRSSMPILVLTARDALEDRIRGLDAGADDYLTKPFSMRELTARVRAIIRRMERIQQLSPSDTVTRFDLTVDAARRRVFQGDEEITLTPLEFEILLTLARSPGVVLSRDQLMDRVWGYRDYAGGRVVDSHVARIRRKLGDEAAEPRYVRTVHGVGYAFRENESGA